MSSTDLRPSKLTGNPLSLTVTVDEETDEFVIYLFVDTLPGRLFDAMGRGETIKTALDATLADLEED